MTKTSVIAALALAALAIAGVGSAHAATAPVPHMPAESAVASADLTGFTVTLPRLVGGPSATDYAAYYDGDGPNLPGLIRSYDDYSRYADARGVAVASVLDASVMPAVTRDPALADLYGDAPVRMAGTGLRGGYLA